MARASKKDDKPAKKSKKASAEKATKKSSKKSAVAEKPAKKSSKKAVVDEKPTKKSKKASAEKVVKKSSKKAVVDEKPTKGKKSKKGDIAEAVQSFFDPYANIDGELDRIDKDLALSGSSLNLSEQRMSTGLLGLDLVVGKGMVPGWYTVYGPEQSCKSTGAMAIMSSALLSNVPIKAYFDYEGSGEPTYIENMLETNGIDLKIEDVFGVQDPRTSKWIKPPMIRYQKPQVAERFFDYVFKLEKKLPDKVCIGDDWYYVYEDNKENRKLVGDKFDKNYWRRSKMLRVPAKDGTPQALIVVDSYPAMLPERLDDVDAGSGMAAQARMFSEQIKRIKGRLASKRIIIVGVNQLRQRPAVMYGCLHGDTMVNLTDGRSIRIREIVEKKIRGKVWSINETTGELEQKRIIDWHHNGDVEKKEDWLKVTARNPLSRAFSSVTLTQDHEVLIDGSGWKKAKDLRTGDRVVSRIPSKVNGTLEEFVLGMLVDDATIVAETKALGTLKFSKEAKYASWKFDMLKSCMAMIDTGATRNASYASGRIEDLLYLRESFQSNLANVRLSAIGLAVAFTSTGVVNDKGNVVFTLPRFAGDKRKLDWFATQVKNLSSAKCRVSVADGSVTVLGGAAPESLLGMIAQYLPPASLAALTDKASCLQSRRYRLNNKVGVRSVGVEVISIEPGTDSLMRSTGKYDIAVEDNPNYMAGSASGGFIVHNSPEYEPCGDALKFYSDCRLRFNPRALSGVPYVKGKGMVLEEPSVTVKGGKDQYRFIHVRAVKNKLGMPYLESWVRLWIEDGNGDARGFDPVWDTFMYLENTGQIEHKAMRNIKLKIKKHESAKTIDWSDFKRLIVGTRKQIKEVCEKAGLKPFELRKFCLDQLANKDGMLLFIDHKKSGGEREDGDDEDEGSSDDDAD